MELIITHRHYQLLNWSIVCFDFIMSHDSFKTLLCVVFTYEVPPC